MRWPKKRAGLELLTDCEAMDRVRKGDKEAFAVLVRRFQDPLLNFFRRLGVYPDAEDLVQESFVRIYQSRQRYRPTAKFRTFLYTVARSVWVDWVRRQARRQTLSNAYAEYIETHPARGLARPVTHMDIQTALLSLPEKMRLVVVMSLYQGLKYREIAEVLEIPLGTVKSRMSLAIARLREYMHAGFETERLQR